MRKITDNKEDVSLDRAMNEIEAAEFLGWGISKLQKTRRPGAYGPPYHKSNPGKLRSKVTYYLSELNQFKNRTKIDPKAA